MATPENTNDDDDIEAVKATIDEAAATPKRDIDEELLTDSERAALADDLGEDGYGEEEDGDDDTTQTDEIAEAARIAAEQEAAMAAKTEIPAAADMPDMDDLTQKLADLKTAEEDLKKQWNDGDLADEAYHEALKANVREAARLETQQERAAEAIQAENERWSDAVKSYKAANPDLFANDKVRGALDRLVGEVTSNPLYAVLPFEKQLERAHIRLHQDAELLGLGEIAAPKTSAKKETAKADQTPEKRKRPEPPPTLSRIPASDATGPEDGRFSQIDRLDGQVKPEVAEAMLLRMTPQEREAYGAGDDY
jgi:hypothetical protein